MSLFLVCHLPAAINSSFGQSGQSGQRRSLRVCLHASVCLLVLSRASTDPQLGFYTIEILTNLPLTRDSTYGCIDSYGVKDMHGYQ